MSGIRDFLRQMVESPMAFYSPTRSQAKIILSAIRQHFGLDLVEPSWREYLTVREGNSNKFHYFAVFRAGNKFVAANAHGRIGYTPIVTEIGDGYGSADKAKAACQEKIDYKRRTRGYRPDKLV
jgi:hypothetical protein